MSSGNKRIQLIKTASGRWRSVWRSSRGWWATAPDYGQRPLGPYATRDEALAVIEERENPDG